MSGGSLFGRVCGHTVCGWGGWVQPPFLADSESGRGPYHPWQPHNWEPISRRVWGTGRWRLLWRGGWPMARGGRGGEQFFGGAVKCLHGIQRRPGARWHWPAWVRVASRNGRLALLLGWKWPRYHHCMRHLTFSAANFHTFAFSGTVCHCQLLRNRLRHCISEPARI